MSLMATSFSSHQCCIFNTCETSLLQGANSALVQKCFLVKTILINAVESDGFAISLVTHSFLQSLQILAIQTRQ